MAGSPDPPAPNSRAAQKKSSNLQHVRESEAASLNSSHQATKPTTNNINPSIDVSNEPTRRSSRRQSQNEAVPQDSPAAPESSSKMSKIHVSNVNQTVVAEGTNQEPPNNPNSNDEQPTKPKSTHKRKMPKKAKAGLGCRIARGVPITRLRLAKLPRFRKMHFSWIPWWMLN